ncbi:protein TALPID3 isoform X2 [Triplophysa dalaica]|uniref:protein TALPID3 isoform X2 n=1 Tax=Triplophysa dalaica TaxID=1582913 RepID=UPI0024DF472A|nr:protein TALPID3 isoform X2 [Triplophysa dalaica]
MEPCVSVINNTHLNDSTSSSDAADVLIGSTRVSVDPSKVQKQHHNKVNIYIRRISDTAHVSFEDDGCIEGDRPSLNTPPGSKTERPTVQQACGPSKQVPDPLNKDPRQKKNKAQTIMQTGNTKLKGEDVHISRYSADGRGAVSAALKKRSQSAPINRSVTVQLLDQERSQSPKVLNDPPCPSVDTGASATVAAISAAAIAATAPLLKAQSEMEAQIVRVSTELKRLQGSEASALQGRADTSAGRVTHLEEQLNVLIQQRIQHLETIQCQQIQLQNRLLDSALDAVTARANAGSHTYHTASEISQTESLPAHTSTGKTFAGSLEAASKFENIEKLTGGHKSPMETPAPRKVVPKPTNWTSTAKAIKPQRTSNKTQGNGRLQDQNRNKQRSPERCDVQSVGVKRFAMATADNGQPEQSRSTEMSPKASCSENQGPSEPAVKQRSKLEDQREQTHMTSSSSAVQRAGEMLRDLGQLKNEMSRLMQSADAFPAQHAKSTQNSRSSHLTPFTPVPPPSTTPISMPSDPVDAIPTRAVPLNRPSILKSIQPPTSMFEDAGQVLRRVRQRKKVLEENLQAILRAKDGEVLYAQLEALSKNRDVSKELRIKKTVDAWINTLSKEIQDELARESSVSEKRIVESNNAAVTKMVQQGQGSESSRRAGARGGGRGGGGGETSAMEKKTFLRGSVRAQAENTLPHGKQPTVCVRTKPEVNQEMPVVVKTQDDHEYLAKLYGKALYEGHRRTLKKAPYLRFTSPTLKSKSQRPKVIETVRGVVMKSSKTQTSPSVNAVSGLQPSVSEPHFLFSPSDSAQQHQPGSPVGGYLIPMAIPLGKPRVDSQAPVPSQITIRDKTPIVTASFPPTTIAEPKPAPVIRKPNTILLEVQSEPKKRRPQLEIQVQPGVNIESVLCSGPASSAQSISPDPILPPPIIDAVEEQHAHEDEEENIFPGTYFLEVADISQETHVGDSPVELKGLPSPPTALYHGPAFPPQPHRSTPLTEPVLNNILQRETLENRLVDWVEQQLMARMITEMFPQPVQADPASQSELENSVTSDIVETAGGAGLQLFVDAGVPVDSELIRECVNEVLTETVALMLGQRETQRDPAEHAHTQETHTQEEVTLVPTPVSTPEPILKEPPSPVRTPDLSEHPSALSLEENQPQELTSPGPARIPVDTPTTTPIPSPIRVDTPSPPPASQSPESASLPNRPGEDTELPLQEEEPHSEREEEQPPPIVMSVAREDEEESVIPTLSPPFPVIREPRLPSSAAGSESSSTEESSSSSSDTVTETETAGRHISEGELLFSHGQMAAGRALNEEGIILPNWLSSLNNSMHGVQDMDYDPPSEGQVIRGPRLQAHHDPILSLLARMDHGPVNQLEQPERWWVEESSGEISEGQRPLLNAAEESVLTGHSLIDQQRSAQPRNTEVSPHATLTSPGQVLTDHTGAVAEESELSVTLRSSREPREAEVYHVIPVSSPQPEDTEHQQSTETTQMVHRPEAILVRQYRDEEEPGMQHRAVPAVPCPPVKREIRRRDKVPRTDG